MTAITGRSLWADTTPDDEVARPVAGTTTDADVIIVGAGYTGLWSAHFLLRNDPALRIVMLEREHIGFGASGRNGGWCSALLPMSLDTITRGHGAAAATRLQHAMHDTVARVGAFTDEYAPAGVLHRGGTVDLARATPHVERLQHELDTYRRYGFGEDDYRWLERDEAVGICNATKTSGAFATPHCATVHPLRLVHTLARQVVDAGADIREGVAVHRIDPGGVETDHGRFRAEIVVRATEGYTPQLDGERRSILPTYSLMIATEPLDDDMWEQIGLRDRPTFADGRHMIIYGQRTDDGRFAFGGRGAPYHFGSAIRPSFDTDSTIRERLVVALREMFPVIAGASITHHWGGVLGVPRDWHCGVRFDRRTGLAVAGGYVGDGVATAHLAGRTLAALVNGGDDDEQRELMRLPWVGHRSPTWEPEPLRWIGVNAGRQAALLADRSEARTDRPSRWWAALLDVLLGRRRLRRPGTRRADDRSAPTG